MPASFGTFQIGDRNFRVTDATLSGTLRPLGPIEWYLEVVTERDEDLWDPRAYIEKYPSETRSMSEFLAAGICIPSGEEFCERTIMPGRRLCCLYVLEHGYLDANQIRFERAGGNQIRVVWMANGYVYRGPPGKLDVNIDTVIDFLGFAVPASDEPAARKLFEGRFEPQGFEFHREPGTEGSFFLPVPDEW